MTLLKLNSKNPRIGIFDSGVGGLTVARAISRILPLPLIYFGDSARLPYGNKSKENILSYSRENVELLLDHGAKIIVIACNTSSAIAIDYLRSRFKVPIIGVVDPGVMAVLHSLEKSKSFISKSKKKGITVAATFRTIDSHIYRKKILACHPGLKVHEIACPLLVPMIEEGMTHNRILNEVLKKYLNKAAIQSQILLLGCTHYPLIKNEFKKTFPHLHIVDSAESTAYYLREILSQGELPPQEFYVKKLPISMIRISQQLSEKLSQKKRSGEIKIFTNDSNEVFTSISQKLFPGVNIRRVTFP